MVKAVIFDLDGTLTDTIGDLADAVNYVLRKNGLPTHSEKEYFYFLGNGAHYLVKKACPEDLPEEKVLSLLSEYMDHYKDHYVDRTVPYPNICETLKKLREKGVELAVCSNKPQNMTEKVCEKFFDGTFAYVFGNNERFPLKPDPTAPLWIAGQLSAKPEETVFVGDTEVDIRTGKNAGFVTVGVSWGFRTVDEISAEGPDYIIDKAEELLDIIEKV